MHPFKDLIADAFLTRGLIPLQTSIPEADELGEDFDLLRARLDGVSAGMPAGVAGEEVSTHVRLLEVVRLC